MMPGIKGLIYEPKMLLWESKNGEHSLFYFNLHVIINFQMGASGSAKENSDIVI